MSGYHPVIMSEYQYLHSVLVIQNRVLRRICEDKQLAAMLLQKKPIVQVVAANFLVRIPVLKVVCEWFLP